MVPGGPGSTVEERGPWLPRGKRRKGCERVRGVVGTGGLAEVEEGGVRTQAPGQPTTPPPQGDHWSVCQSAPLPDLIQYLLELSGEVHIPQHSGLSWVPPPLSCHLCPLALNLTLEPPS